MPRKRRQPKRRALMPQGLSEISLCERASWACSGQHIVAAGDVFCGEGHHEWYHEWPDWATWARFYEGIREELFAKRPWLRETSVADAVYVAWREGRDPAVLRDELCAARAANDPRRVLFDRVRGGGGRAT